MSHDGPIIIRKKRDDGEEEHHGGVWKLAFADFMTAMMAFFLVMWLINSTSKETKAAIVQYFNPIKLVDSTNAHRGLRDPASGAQGKSAVAPPPNEEVSGANDKADAIFAEPLKTLDEIARSDPAPETPRDPFDRLSRHMKRTNDEGPRPEAAGERTTAPHAPAASTDARKAAAQLEAEVDRIAALERNAPKVEVKQLDDGLLISLTDDASFSMFDVGSIQPKPQLVRILGGVGKLLAARSGEIELRGHTDARSYTGKNYDNWRLSSDRAGVVNYMLIRGGLPAARIGKIVGFADRRLKNPKEPFSPVNRRIEILLHDRAP